MACCRLCSITVFEQRLLVQPFEGVAVNILYLTCLESVIDNGVYDSQVKNLLCKLKSLYGPRVDITNLAVIPAVTIGGTGIHIPFLHDRDQIIRLTEQFRRNDINFRILYIPLVTIKRWNFYLNTPMLAINLLIAFPLIAYHVVRYRYELVHCRSYVATICAVLLKFLLPNVKVVFDVRGFYPEEGILQGCWKTHSLSYKMWKYLERYLLVTSDKVIALSDTFMQHICQIEPEAKCSVIFASVDVDSFRFDPHVRKRLRKEMGLQGSTVFVYNGGLGSWHDPAMLTRVYKAIKSRMGNSKLLILTKYDKARLVELLRKAGFHDGDHIILRCQPGEVVRYLQVADYGIVPLRDLNGDYARRIIGHTMIGLKVAEYLACGLPIIVNSDVGGIKSLMARYKIGVEFSREELWNLHSNVSSVDSRYETYRDECLSVARNFFSVDEAAKSYYEIYRELAPD